MAQSVPEVVRWKPRHDIVCLMHVAGKMNKDIAEHLKLNQQRVSDIINSRRGQVRIAELRERVLGGVEADIESRLTALGPQAVTNIARTIKAELPATSSRAKAHQDKVSFELLSRIGFGRKENGGAAEAGIKLDRDIQNRLVSALEKSAEATRIYDLPAEEAVVIESANGDSHPG